MDSGNHVASLNEYAQRRRLTLSYEFLGSAGPDHNKTFSMRAVIDGNPYPNGVGKTKKDAKQDAAKNALTRLLENKNQDPVEPSVNAAEASAAAALQTSPRSINYICWLNEYGQKNRVDVRAVESAGVGANFATQKSLREVRTLSKLLHPNVVRYYTCWIEDSGYQWEALVGRFSTFLSAKNSKFLYIQLELCDTKTLKDWIEEKNAESLTDFKRGEQSLNIAVQIFSGVEYIHSMNHIHRDLKPANILFGLDGKVKIGDFGLVTRDDTLNKTVNRGTPNYMAPEQKIGRNYDKKVDIFALGLVFVELLWKLPTGHERAVVFEEAKRQKLPTEFVRRFLQEAKIIKSMLSEKPEERPEASAVRAELEQRAQIKAAGGHDGPE
ncbi:interferon-induced, double-stranded RNA-activated protein kinase-like [Tautogolabrus adspersus]